MPRNHENVHHTLWLARKYKQTGREPYRLREHPEEQLRFM